MSVFQDIELGWNGKQFTIPANRVMGAIARIEEVVTLVELQRCNEANKAPIAKLCMAFGAVLRYAGCMVDDDEVYAGLFEDGKTGNVMESLTVILAMMVPPETLASVQEQPKPGKPRKAAANSSRKRTRRRS
jgi:hypothetical protein